MTHYVSISTALKDLQNGKMIIVTDNKERENEGDFIIAAEYATNEAINFMITHGRGLVCLSLQEQQIQKLGIHMQTRGYSHDNDRFGTAFTTSIEAKTGVTTGISPADRSHTILTAIAPHVTPTDISIPGHIFPLCGRAGGVLERPGHTEAAIDLTSLAGLNPSGVICEIINDDGSMAQVSDLEKISKKYHINMVSIDDLITYRNQHENRAVYIETAHLPNMYGQEFTITGYCDKFTHEEAVVISIGEPHTQESPLIRLHSQCLTGDVFGSLRCDCGPQLHLALQKLKEAGHGAILYLFQEGRGIGILNKIKAYQLQEQGFDTIEANLKLGFHNDIRNYAFAASILKHMNIHHIQLLSNNPDKIQQLELYGIHITNRIPLETKKTKHNSHYLQIKKQKMGHFL